jgi:hypothetical protein
MVEYQKECDVMRATVILVIGAGILVSGCATRREIIQADRYDARVQRAECREAKAYRGKRAQAIECAEARDAKAQLRADQAAPY